METKGMFFNAFDTFEEGIEALMGLSFSVRDSIHAQGRDLKSAKENGVLETVVSQILATNAIQNRPTGNGVGWNAAAFIQPDSVEYRTSGGLGFGWYLRFCGNHGSEHYYVFYIRHPKGENMEEESSMKKSALEAGWKPQPDTFWLFRGLKLNFK